MLNVNCVAHNIHRLCETIRNIAPHADKLVNNLKKAFRRSPFRISLFKSKHPTIPIPPSPVITQWGTWVSAVIYICRYFDELVTFFE